ncbi:iron complex transport system permease protein [Cryobacterium sp. MP_3.1]|uniref:FecCD family ABC transporter permease n=1 Tax=unclassified Cryobacterium TaxID=2649013 RepID=UPI00106B091E|nr:iron complex transport system permease protein [Cryobacterium sp. MP_3.1]TFC53783.1 iron ABC transporter permease [Cryobacterium sp. TMB3-1-2]TFC58888.1 iron ABC transporter permease [Cryobacterium sp. TMB1-7]TFC75203.1 iron ABC transporter permease [Cryobacterium sp. TMB3-15]TFC75339.1 iron ABC transporter permease [Cryobacterium sp. TMB3-10]TFC92652.1 iron ABC transporter permease [Cryobacterium sp. TMT4-31]TFD41616.1 iron ABC transporter permease [Cryobacterium sp. TMB3-12]
MGRAQGRALSTVEAASVTRGRPLPRAVLALALGLLGLVAIVLSVGVAVTLGPADVSLVNVRDILLNHLALTDIPVRVSEDAIVWQERLPRALVAAACGAGLGLSGVILQSLLRNPLADPFVLGVSSGASTGAVLVGVLGIGGGAIGLSGGAFIGALAAFGFVLLLARFSSAGTAGVILAGVASTQLFSALTSLVVFAFADSDETRGVMFWLLGSLEGMRWDDVALSSGVVTVGALICLVWARSLDAFAFGEDVAASLGIHVGRTRLILLIVTALLTATLVSIAGAIGFVGLVLPHAARLLFGQRHSRVIPATIVLGAVFMVWVDAASRVVFAPTPLPVGVGTALVGVPVFVLLLLRNKGRGRA